MKNVVVLIGMSGVGKSYHSRKMKEKGDVLFSIDNKIAKALGEKNVHDIALWLGNPYEDRYTENSKKYIELENTFTREAFSYARSHPNERVIIDTTGSLVHLPKETLLELTHFHNVILLDTNERSIKGLIEKYLSDPKPVIWGDMAHYFKENIFKEQVTKKYPELLKIRRILYKKYAKVIVPFEEHKKKEWKVVLD